ncbi:MAG: hypothetical protein RLZZ502_1196 [Pseudomonadota bacterium]|jgi:tripartite-type tricarboxylate transporter receptor subunit TctC
MKLTPLFTTLILSVSALHSPAVLAQNFPSKAVKLITPFPVGSGPEGVLRLLAEQLSRKWGQPVIVDNKPGANGFIAIEQVKRAPADGHELVQMDTSQMTVYPSLFKKIPYDLDKDFEPILPLFSNYFMVTVGKDSKYQTVAELLTDAKSNPGKVNFGSWSVGNPVHIASGMLATASDTQMQHVTYKETSALYIAVANKELDWALGSVGTAGALQRADKIRYLATTAPKRQAGWPQVPTVEEAGGPKGFEFSAWTALVSPKGVPASVLDKLHKDISEVINTPEMKAKFAALAYDAYPMSRGQFSQLLKRETERNGRVVKQLNLQLD